jgi:hypothetical protein
MAVSNLMTITEYAKSFAIEDIRRPPIEMFAKSTDLFDALPFEGLKGSVFQYYRQAVLPTPQFRAINESSSSGHGVITPLQENTCIIDHDIDVDRAIVDRHGTERRNYEEMMGLTGFGQLWATTIIKGDQSTNPRVFNGLQVRAGKYSRTTHNSAASGGAALSLLKLDQAIAQVNKPTHIIVPYLSKALWIQAARTTTLSGFVMQTWDGVGEPKVSYAGCRCCSAIRRTITPTCSTSTKSRPAAARPSPRRSTWSRSANTACAACSSARWRCATSACCRTARPTARI